MTRQEIEQRIQQLYQFAAATYSMVCEAKAQYLESCLDSGMDLEDIDEQDYHPWVESLCDDYAFRETYDYWMKEDIFLGEGQTSLPGYIWMVWALAGDETTEFHDLMTEWAQEQDLPTPAYLECDTY